MWAARSKNIFIYYFKEFVACEFFDKNVIPNRKKHLYAQHDPLTNT